jgi:hypothetical protein
VVRETKPSLEAKTKAESGKKIFSKSSMAYTGDGSIEVHD